MVCWCRVNPALRKARTYSVPALALRRIAFLIDTRALVPVRLACQALSDSYLVGAADRNSLMSMADYLMCQHRWMTVVHSCEAHLSRCPVLGDYATDPMRCLLISPYAVSWANGSFGWPTQVRKSCGCIGSLRELRPATPSRCKIMRCRCQKSTLQTGAANMMPITRRWAQVPILPSPANSLDGLVEALEETGSVTVLEGSGPTRYRSEFS
jgi:hypothetical protein